MLKIKTVFYLTSKRDEEIEKQYEHAVWHEVHEPKKPVLDMDALSDQVQSLLKEGKGPIFMFCVSG